ADRRLFRRVAKLLAADAGLKHQSAFLHGEDGDAVVVVRSLRRTRLHGHRRNAGGDFEIALLETIERGLVLEENSLAVGLAAGLQADGDLRHLAGANAVALLEHRAVALGAADAETALGDLRKDCVAIGVLEKALHARIGALELFDCGECRLLAGWIPSERAPGAGDQTRGDKSRDEFPRHAISPTFSICGYNPAPNLSCRNGDE